jgi:hypothetical protein
MTTTSGAPVEAPPDDESTRRSGNQLLVLASEATILVGAGWLIAMVVPYLAAPDGTTIALADGDPLRASTIGPRLVGVLLSAGPAALALALPRWRAALFCTSAAALATLAAYSVWWALAVRTGFGFAPRVGWFWPSR